MEEWVGLKWHDYVTRQAMGEFPEYACLLYTSPSPRD